MFNKWLESNTAVDFDLTAPLYPEAADRAFWDAVDGGEKIRDAETYLRYEWPLIRATDYIDYMATGCRRTQEIPHFARRCALSVLVLGEIAEHRGRFIPDITDGLMAICEETFWGVAAHSYSQNIPDGSKESIDLFAAETGALLAITCYMLKGELEEFCPLILKRVEAELRRRILEPYISRTDFFWMGYGYPVNNWNAWIISNILTVYLLCEKDPETLGRAVDKMMLEINRLYNSYPEDGGCDEGASYWSVSGGSLFEFCDQLYVASGGKIDFFGDGKLRRIGEFEYHMYIGDGYFVNFADGTPKVTHSMTGLLWMMGLRTGDRRYFGLAKDLMLHDPEREGITPVAERDAKLRRRLYEMIYSRDIAASPEYVPAERAFYGDLQIAVLRGGDFCVAAKGGHNGENHNHNDVGSFIAYYENEPVLADPSCGTYVRLSFNNGDSGRYGIWTNNSEWHNLPVINGVLQKCGKEFGADSFELHEKTVSVSFAGAYPEAAAVEKVCRTITVVDDAVTVTDSVAFIGEGCLTENFITPLDVITEGGRAVIDGRFELVCDTPADVTSDSADFEGDERLTLYWKGDRMKRITFTFPEGERCDVRFTLRRIK